MFSFESQHMQLAQHPTSIHEKYYPINVLIWAAEYQVHLYNMFNYTLQFCGTCATQIFAQQSLDPTVLIADGNKDSLAIPASTLFK